ncbi:MAG TPA: subclass B1 metallo-beta-lactamase [Vicinamibacteria bacterium]|nr:subclass B1 metallo-beta-lactamase [Vicinamibacteria bacterium]
MDHPLRPRALAAMVAALCVAVAAGAEEVSPDLQVRELRPGVWLHTSWQALEGGTRFPSNGLIVRERDHLLLVDTAWGEPLTEQLLAWIERRLRRRVRAAVVTHFHGDRLGGAAALQRRGIPFHGHPLTAQLAPTVKLPPPQVLPDLERPGASASWRSLEVFYPGPAHTRDNVVVWLPGPRVLFGGCPVRAAGATALGNLADADVKEYAASMRRLLARYPRARLVVPGHGQPGGLELVRHTVDLAAAATR